MSKIICDVCGTSYPSSSECCPICGCTSTGADEFLGSDIQLDDFFLQQDEKADNRPATGKRKGIFDYDEVNMKAAPEEEDDDEEDFDEEEYEEEEEASGHNTFIVILLTVLIVVLLGAAAFLFVRYFLPNMRPEETVPPATQLQQTEAAAPSTEPTIPCQQMAMTNAGIAELNAQGQQFLLHIKALPENTTDKIIYTSGDESIATVTEDGKITAVSEGETVIYISCGKTSMECPVIVKYVEETVPPTTAAAVEETTAETTAETTGEDASETPEETTETEEPEEPEGTEAAGETAPEQEDTDGEDSSDANVNSNVTLKLKKTDIQLGVYYQFQLQLDCELDPEDVTWSSEHPHIATVDEQGNVTAVKAGTTAITAKYGDQEVQCLVRCIWY